MWILVDESLLIEVAHHVDFTFVFFSRSPVFGGVTEANCADLRIPVYTLWRREL